MFTKANSIQNLQNATMKQQLLLLLQTFDESALKEIVHISYTNCNEYEIFQLKRASISIEDILPPDTLQHIISFYNCQILRFVSKKFMKLYELNLHQQYKAQSITYNKYVKNTINIAPVTWILDCDRTELTCEENNCDINYRFSTDDLQQTISKCKYG
eukprot:309820_1